VKRHLLWASVIGVLVVYPSYGRSRACIRNDDGKHKGWYKHGR
jgi:hypothetical protein